MINDTLEKENKKIVFIFENIDRATDDNVLLIYKIISSILKINRILYVLSYDKNIVNKIFERKNIDVRFPEKIIQKEILLPQLQNYQFNNVIIDSLKKIKGIKCSNNSYSQLELNDINSNFDNMISVLEKVNLDVFTNLRQVIKILNDFLFVAFNHDDINLSDYLFLIILKNMNYDLYLLIWNKKEWFLNLIDSNNERYFDTKEKDVKEYFNELFIYENNKKYKKIIKKMFPVVNYYLGGNYPHPSELEERELQKSISSKYFLLYFLREFNSNLELIDEKKIKNVFYKIKDGENIDVLLNDLFSDRINEKYSKFIKYLVDNNFGLSEEKIKDIYFFLIKKGDTFIYGKDDYFAYFENIKNLSRFIGTLNKKDFLKVRSMFDNYAKLDFNREVVFHSKKYLNDGEKINNNYLEIEKINDINIGKIIKNKINIYSKEYYGRYNIFAFENKRGTKTLLKTILREDNVLLFLKNFINNYYKGAYRYYLNKESLKKYVDITVINKLINKIDKNTLNDEELFIFKVYNLAKFNDSKSLFEREDVYVSNERINL